MKPTDPSHAKSMRALFTVLDVSPSALSAFGPPHHHETDPAVVLAPAEHWAFELEDGTTCVIEFMPDVSMLIVYASDGTAEEVAAALGLFGREIHPVVSLPSAPPDER